MAHELSLGFQGVPKSKQVAESCETTNCLGWLFWWCLLTSIASYDHIESYRYIMLYHFTCYISVIFCNIYVYIYICTDRDDMHRHMGWLDPALTRLVQVLPVLLGPGANWGDLKFGPWICCVPHGFPIDSPFWDSHTFPIFREFHRWTDIQSISLAFRIGVPRVPWNRSYKHLCIYIYRYDRSFSDIL